MENLTCQTKADNACLNCIAHAAILPLTRAAVSGLAISTAERGKGGLQKAALPGNRGTSLLDVARLEMRLEEVELLFCLNNQLLEEI